MKNSLLILVAVCFPFMLNGQVSPILQYTFSNAVYPNGYVADSSGNGNDADIVDFTLASTGYEAGVAETLSLDSRTRQVTVIRMDSINVVAKAYKGIPGTGPRTIMAWVKIDTIPLMVSDGLFVTYGATKDFRFEVTFAGGGHIRFNNKAVERRSEGTVGHLVWNHVAITYDGLALKFFIDGVETDTFNIVLNTANETPVIAGGFSSGKKFYKGMMYDFRMYTSALSEQEINGVIDETIGYPVGISGERFSADHGFVYPNPAGSSIQLKGLYQSAEFDIYDVTGRKVQRGYLHALGAILVEDLKSGIYFLKVRGSENSYRFVKE